MSEPVFGPAEDGEAWSKPLQTEHLQVERGVWDRWCADVRASQRSAKRVAAILASAVGVGTLVAGIGVFPSAWKLSAILYATLGAWVISRAAHATVLRHSTSSTIAQMRATLAPSIVAAFDERVLIDVLSHHRVPAARHHRMVLIHLEPETVQIAVEEYDMSRFPSSEIPNANGGYAM